MAAPTPSVPVTPGGIKLKDGFSAKVVFSLDTDASLWVKTATPPPLEMGDAIDQTTMWNETYVTKAIQALIDVGNGQFTCAYDPNVYNNVIAMMGPTKEQTITWVFSDGSTLAHYGFIKNFVPGAMSRGAQPEATVEVVCTNWDPSGKVEAAPVLTSVAGT